MNIIVLLIAVGCAAIAVAEDFVVAAGEPWPHTTTTLKPGDRVYLAPGAHRAQTLTSLRGTKEAPIEFRSVDPSQPATIIGGDVSLNLLGCSYVSIGPMLLAAGEMGGISIVGSSKAPCVGITVRGVVLARPGLHSGRGSGITATNVRDLTIERVRIESWADASILLNHATNVSIVGTATIAANESKRGFVMTGASTHVSIERSIVEALKGPGVWLNDTTHVSVAGCGFAKCTHPLELGACSNISIAFNTFFEPRDHPISFFGAATNITLDSNLFVWKPGSISSLFNDAARATSITLTSNLWWSDEMPEALDSLGAFPGEQTAPQRTNIDPSLDPRALSPRNPIAQAFGHTAFRRVPAEIAPKSDADNPKGP